MAALSITEDQNTAILDPVEPYLEDAMAEGVKVGIVPVVPLLPEYTTLDNDAKTTVKNTWKLVIAAVAKAFNIHGPLPTGFSSGTRFTGTITLAKLTDLGANGSMTITDGVVTAYSAPS